jgi:hypothetical protein
MRMLAIIGLLLMLLLTVPAGMQAVIVDRVAVAVGNRVITQSEIDLRIRLTAFQNGEKPDFSLAARRQATQRLIDQKLVEREMEDGNFPRTTPERGKQLLADYQESHYPVGKTAMLTALKADGLTEADLEQELIAQADLLTFLNLRFGAAIMVDDQEVKKYFDEKIPDGPQKNPEQFSVMRPQIEQLLAKQRADLDLEAWLKEQRQRLKIEYVDKDLAETSTAK